jgi:hypothetical protein
MAGRGDEDITRRQDVPAAKHSDYFSLRYHLEGHVIVRIGACEERSVALLSRPPSALLFSVGPSISFVSSRLASSLWGTAAQPSIRKIGFCTSL